MGIGDARNGRHAPPQLMRHAQVGGAIATDDPNIDLRRQAEIEDLRGHVGGLEIEGHRRKGGRQHLAQPTHVVRSRRVSLLEGYQDHAVIDVDGRAVAESEVVRPLRHANVVDDELALPLRNDFADLVLDFLEDAFGGFHAGRRRCTDVKLDLSPVDCGEEVVADHGEHHASQREHQHGGDRDNERPLEQHREHAHVAPAKQLETTLELLVKPREPVVGALCPTVVLALEEEADDNRRQRPRQCIGRQHREHDREAERREQEFGRPFEEHHRREHAADRQRRDHGRHCNAGGAVQRRGGEIHASAAQPVGVLDRHRRIVDQDADRQRHAAERHGVERVAYEVEDDDGGEDRQRNRDQNDQGRTP